MYLEVAANPLEQLGTKCTHGDQCCSCPLNCGVQSTSYDAWTCGLTRPDTSRPYLASP